MGLYSWAQPNKRRLQSTAARMSPRASAITAKLLKHNAPSRVREPFFCKIFLKMGSAVPPCCPALRAFERPVMLSPSRSVRIRAPYSPYIPSCPLQAHHYQSPYSQVVSARTALPDRQTRADCVGFFPFPSRFACSKIDQEVSEIRSLATFRD